MTKIMFETLFIKMMYYLVSCLIASTGEISAALFAGKKPAKTPDRINKNKEKVITEKSILAVVNKKSFVSTNETNIQFNRYRNNEPKQIPIMPANDVISIDSVMIIQIIDFEFAPIALRIPISKVRSFTITNIILLMPTTPLNKRHKPTNHRKKLTPLNSLSNIFI